MLNQLHILKHCANHHLCQIPKHFLSPQKKMLYPLSSPPSFSHLLSPWLSVSKNCLCWTFHINGIIQYVNFCVWLFSLNTFSRLIHVVAISGLHLFLAKNNIPSYEYTTFCLSLHLLWTFGLFPASGYRTQMLTAALFMSIC